MSLEKTKTSIVKTTYFKKPRVLRTEHQTHKRGGQLKKTTITTLQIGERELLPTLAKDERTVLNIGGIYPIFARRVRHQP